MSEEKKISGYRIKPINQGGELVAVLTPRQSTVFQNVNRPPTVIREWVLNEESLAARVASLEGQGVDASVSRKALASLRTAKGSAPSRDPT